MLPLVFIQSPIPTEAPVPNTPFAKEPIQGLLNFVPPPPDFLNDTPSQVFSHMATLSTLSAEIDRRLAQLEKDHSALRAALKSSPETTTKTNLPEIQAMMACLHDADFETAQKEYSQVTAEVVEAMKDESLHLRASDSALGSVLAASAEEELKNSPQYGDHEANGRHIITTTVKVPMVQTTSRKLASLSASYSPVFSKFQTAFRMHNQRVNSASDKAHAVNSTKLVDYLDQAISIQDLNLLKTLVQIQTNWFHLTARL